MVNRIENVMSAFDQNGLSDVITKESAEKLCKLSDLLVETNKMFNLTAITDEQEIILKHFVDSATILRFIPFGASVIDIGCGAGFPSLPIAILRGDIKVTSLDSTKKKVDFVNFVAEKLNLLNLTGICARAEEYVAERRQNFDICTSRAVARLNVLSELCLPYVKVGGSFVAMKSNKLAEEYDEAKIGIVKLGGRFDGTNEFLLNFAGNEISREISVFVKCKDTPMEYPRKYSQILKRPL